MDLAFSKRQKAVLEVVSKPKYVSEIREHMGLSRKNNISKTLKELAKLNLIYCLNPKAYVGRLYGLTSKGKRIRKRLCDGNYCQTDVINWNLYGKIACGKQRRAILKAMDIIPIPLKYIRQIVKEKYNPRLSRTNTNDILQWLVKMKVIRKIRKDYGVFFKLTKTGEGIRKQIILRENPKE